MDWNPKREKRIKRHDLDYTLPRDRQIDHIKVNRPGEAILVTDTVFPIYCLTCDEMFRKPTKWQSEHAHSEHIDEEHPDAPRQYEIPTWFRRLIESREADISKLQHDHEDHDY